MLIAVYMVLVLKKVEQDEDEDCIDIEPTFDSSSEMIKVKDYNIFSNTCRFLAVNPCVLELKYGYVNSI